MAWVRMVAQFSKELSQEKSKALKFQIAIIIITEFKKKIVSEYIQLSFELSSYSNLSIEYDDRLVSTDEKEAIDLFLLAGPPACPPAETSPVCN